MKLSGTVVNNLREYYNHQATKYAQTRQKYWAEKQVLQESLEKYYDNYYQNYPSKDENQVFRVLEFGCGDGRFFREVLVPFMESVLKKNPAIVFEYIGVDISQGLLDFASAFADDFIKNNKEYTKNISVKFVCADIVAYIQTCEQETFDCVVGIASFQHIRTYAERLYLMQWFYKVLKYEGIVLLVNRSFSYWFIKKYWKAILGGFGRALLSFGKQERNSLFLPRKTGKSSGKGKEDYQEEIFYRFYHIFLLKEFRKLVLFSSFVLKKLAYIDRHGKLGSDMKNAKNTFFLAQKSVLK